jgi:hypothetical protein
MGFVLRGHTIGARRADFYLKKVLLCPIAFDVVAGWEVSGAGSISARRKIETAFWLFTRTMGIDFFA